MTAGPVSNLHAALKSLEGDRVLLGRMIGIYLDQSPGLFNAIADAVDRNDATALERAAHTLRGSICNFAAPQAQEAAFRLEQMGRAADFSGAREARAELGRALEALRRELVAFTGPER